MNVTVTTHTSAGSPPALILIETSPGSNIWQIEFSKVFNSFSLVLCSYTKGNEDGIKLRIRKKYDSDPFSGFPGFPGWTYVAEGDGYWERTFTSSVTSALEWSGFADLYLISHIQIEVITTNPPGSGAGSAVIDILQNNIYSIVVLK